ncbi:MAG: DUF4276 family protein [Thermodesulfobacteriota bacterium]
MVKLYVEGGGDTAALKAICREGFAKFLRKAGLQGHMPRIVACGSRYNAYSSFCTAVTMGEQAFLLVDSEAPVEALFQEGAFDNWRPWQHLAQRPGDQWQKPEDADESRCHLMTQCMESWFLADRETLRSFFGHGFKENQLPDDAIAVESVAKQEVYDSLVKATKNCKSKARYSKGEHSFKLLALLVPSKVTAASPWAKRFIETMQNHLGQLA